jgi:LemA protein
MPPGSNKDTDQSSHDIDDALFGRIVGRYRMSLSVCILRRACIPLFTVLAGLLLSGCGVNNLPTYDETAKAKWSDVQNQYQRRADLIPNLVETVKGYAARC